MNPSERISIEKRLLSSESLLCNFYLSGHTHAKGVSSLSTTNNIVRFLETGIGWEHDSFSHEGKRDKEHHMYSIYMLNQQYNTCEIVMLKTDADEDYKYDTSHTDEKRIIYPINSNTREIYPIVKITAKGDARTLRANSVVVDNFFLEKTKMISLAFSDILEECYRLVEQYKNDFFESISTEDGGEHSVEDSNHIFEHLFYSGINTDSIEELQQIRVVFEQHKDIVFQLFDGYLSEIPEILYKYFEDIFDIYKDFRIHIRRYNREQDSYSCIKVCPKAEMLRDLPWGGLVKIAHEDKCSLIYSANYDIPDLMPPGEWDDFITFIPELENGIITKEKRVNEKRSTRVKRENLPLLTFGISVKYDEDVDVETYRLLYVLDFLDIRRHISSALNIFTSAFFLENISDFEKFQY